MGTRKSKPYVIKRWIDGEWQQFMEPFGVLDMAKTFAGLDKSGYQIRVINTETDKLEWEKPR